MAKKKAFSKIFNLKLTKTDKKVLKGTALAVGTIALLGASANVLKGFKK